MEVKLTTINSGDIPIDKDIFFDEEIDILTLGVYVRVTSCFIGGTDSIKNIASALGLSEDKTRTCINKLERTGYLVRTPKRDRNGRASGWNYTFYATPVDPSKRSCVGHKSNK